MGILDNVQNTMKKSVKPTSTPRTGQIADILSTGKTGKAPVASSGPKGSSISERMAMANAQAAIGQQQQQGAIAASALGAAADQQTDQMNDAEAQEIQSFETSTASMDNQLADMLEGVRQSREDLELRKDGAKLEQVGFLMRLQNDQYVQQLQIIGEENRLTNQAAFNEESARLLLGEELSNTVNDLQFKGGLNSDQRTWEEGMANLGASDALDIARAALADENAQRVTKGLFDMVGAGVQMYAAMPEAGPLSLTTTENASMSDPTNIRDLPDVSSTSSYGSMS